MVLSNRVNFLLVRLCSLSDHPSISVENHLMAKNNTALATEIEVTEMVNENGSTRKSVKNVTNWKVL